MPDAGDFSPVMEFINKLGYPNPEFTLMRSGWKVKLPGVSSLVASKIYEYASKMQVRVELIDDKL